MYLILCIYFWLCLASAAVQACSRCGTAPELCCAGFSLQRLLSLLSPQSAGSGPRTIPSWGSWAPSCGRRLQSTGSLVVARGLSCSTACEMRSSQVRDRTCVSCIGRWIFTAEPLGRPWHIINVTENRVWLLAAQKLIKRQSLWKESLPQRQTAGGAGHGVVWCPKADPPPPPAN